MVVGLGLCVLGWVCVFGTRVAFRFGVFLGGCVALWVWVFGLSYGFAV